MRDEKGKVRTMVYIESPSYDPYYNLALEQCVFDMLPRAKSYFMLWQNDNSIIIGKHQNTAQEINAAVVKARGAKVTRRLSGGGAVYHDLGNINYTFITDAGNMERLNLQAFCMPLVNALKKLGVNAEVSGRNDVTIDGKKCSGNSQYLKQGRVMHHGTILFDSDLSVIGEVLNIPKDKYESKGAKSVRSHVTNIKPFIKSGIGMQEFKKLLKKSMGSPAMERGELSEAAAEEVERLRKERYSTWEWNYGTSPKYSIQKSRRVEGCGRIDLSMDVNGGVITAFSSYGDYFGSGDSTDVAKKLIGVRIEEEALRAALRDFPTDEYYNNLNTEELIRIILQ